jgi:purine-nucleoside phosphorylase
MVSGEGKGRTELEQAIRRFFPEGTPDQLLFNAFGVPADAITGNVVLSPGWVPERVFPSGSIRELIAATPLYGCGIWQIDHNGTSFTWIRSGFGAPVNLDAVLLLGLTKGKTLLFVSSVGSLIADTRIGDLMIPEYAFSGDGAVRYLTEDIAADPFGRKCHPDPALFLRTREAAAEACGKAAVGLRICRPFCADTIAAEARVFDHALSLGADAMDMETAAVFCAAETMGISAAALLQVSDVPMGNKSLLNGRGDQGDREYRRFVRRTVMPQIITAVMGG